jgi:cell division protein FtsQ
VIIAPADEDDAPARAAAVRVAGALSPEVLRRVGRIEASSPVEVRLVLRDGRLVGWGSAEQSDRKAAVLEVLLDTPATGYDVSVPDRPTLRPVL